MKECDTTDLWGHPSDCIKIFELLYLLEIITLPKKEEKKLYWGGDITKQVPTRKIRKQKIVILALVRNEPFIILVLTPKPSINIMWSFP